MNYICARLLKRWSENSLKKNEHCDEVARKLIVFMVHMTLIFIRFQQVK